MTGPDLARWWADHLPVEVSDQGYWENARVPGLPHLAFSAPTPERAIAGVRNKAEAHALARPETLQAAASWGPIIEALEIDVEWRDSEVLQEVGPYIEYSPAGVILHYKGLSAFGSGDHPLAEACCEMAGAIHQVEAAL